MKKLRVFGLSLALATGILVGGAPSASATTCVVNDVTLQEVECLLWSTAGGVACAKPVSKLGYCPR